MSKHFPTKEELKHMIPMEKSKEEKKPKRQLKADDFENANAAFCISLNNQMSYWFWAAMIRDEGKNPESLDMLKKNKARFSKFFEEACKSDFDLQKFRKETWIKEPEKKN